MENITIAFLLLSIAVLFGGASFYYDVEKEDILLSTVTGSVMFLPLLWAVYFFIV